MKSVVVIFALMIASSSCAPFLKKTGRIYTASVIYLNVFYDYFSCAVAVAYPVAYPIYQPIPYPVYQPVPGK